MKNILYQFIEGQTRFSTSSQVKMFSTNTKRVRHNFCTVIIMGGESRVVAQVPILENFKIEYSPSHD
jgi:hypothetical protein